MQTNQNRHNNASQFGNRLTRSFQNTLSSKDRVDQFNVKVSSLSRFRASLGNIAKNANVNLELINGKGGIVAASRKGGRSPERLEVAELEPGTYKLRAILKQGQKTSYKLRFNSKAIQSLGSDKPVPPLVLDEGPIFQPDQGGNSAATATDRGKIGSSTSTFTDGLNSEDETDWYRITVGDTSGSNRLNLSLRGDNGVVAHLFSTADLNESLGSAVIDSSNKLLSDANVAVASGTYYVKVSSLTPGSKVSYDLNLAATEIADSAGNTKETARVVNNLQPLNTSGQAFSFDDFVGHGDIFDNYTFKTDKKSTLTIKFDRLNTANFDKARILHQLSKVDGLSAASLYWKNSSGASLSSGISALTEPSYTLTGTLEPGTYNLELKSYFFNGDNDYRVTISATSEGV